MLAVSPFAAGTANDIVARIVLDQVGQCSASLSSSRTGRAAAASSASASVVRADPDGYTFMLLSSSSMSSA